ncbi:MAG: ribonuclease III [Armatimonas sp.]
MTRAALAAICGLAEESVLLKTALTHRSAATPNSPSNERLEFLGDALLGAIVAEALFAQLPETVDEGTLSRCRMQVVRRETLAEAGRALGLNTLLEVGEGERREGRQSNDSLLADAYEALLGAIHCEVGLARAQEFVQTTLGAAIVSVVADPPTPDPKSALQERLQAEKRGLPIYEVLSETLEEVRVAVRDASGLPLGEGSGRSKRLATRDAARQALEQL